MFSIADLKYSHQAELYQDYYVFIGVGWKLGIPYTKTFFPNPQEIVIEKMHELP